MPYSTTNTTNVSFTGTSISQDLSSRAKEITVSATAACYISFDATIVSATNGFYIPADQQYTFPVLYPSQIAVIQDSGAGVLSVMELGDSVPGAMNITVKDTYTGNANLFKTEIVTATGDASLLTTIANTFSGDASLTAVDLSTTFSGDAAIMTAVEATFSGDANTAVQYSGSFSGDCHMDV